MAQSASSYWQRFIKNIPAWVLPQFKTGASKRILQRSNPAVFLWFLTIVVAMLLWDPKLFFSCGAGIFVMLLVYSAPQWNWSQFWGEIRNFLQTTPGRLVLSVTSGVIACLGTYTATTIWVNASNVWIGAGAIVEGLATVLILILLARRDLSLYGNQEQDKLEQLLDNLTDSDPLKRLISLRKLRKIASSNLLEPDAKQYIIECLQFLLRKESETAIRDAAFDSLQALEPAQKLVQKSIDKTLVPFSVKAKNRISC
ncbi:MAG: armadillo-type fold-containing protein [Rivularia sp. (in: cyanobacteria)]